MLQFQVTEQCHAAIKAIQAVQEEAQETQASVATEPEHRAESDELLTIMDRLQAILTPGMTVSKPPSVTCCSEFLDTLPEHSSVKLP